MERKLYLLTINVRIDSAYSEFPRIISDKTIEIKDLKSEVGTLINKLTKMEQKILDSEKIERQKTI